MSIYVNFIELFLTLDKSGLPYDRVVGVTVTSGLRYSIPGRFILEEKFREKLEAAEACHNIPADGTISLKSLEKSSALPS